MCGFVAVAEPKGPLGLSLIDRMRDCLAHRGPDDRRSTLIEDPEGRIGLGHRRLSIIDLSASASQPMSSLCGRATVVYNGEIYNYVELRGELKRAGRTFRTSSDTEVLLEAYLHWGSACLSRLNGQFAFALWDGASRELLVARDRFGEKPLYYAQLSHGGLAIASEIKALFAHPALEARLDEEMLRAAASGADDYVSDRTYFAGVRKLRPAHAMRVSPGGRIRDTWRYWTPPFDEPRLRWREADIVAEYRERLEASVRMRLRSDVRVGACLSGGLDSSSIVSALGRIWSERGALGDNFTISARYDDDPTISEGQYIDAVVLKTGVRPLFVTPDPHRLAEEFAAMHWHHEEPGLTGSHYNEWCVMRTARANGCTVMLDGQGSDEVLGGYQYYFPLYQLDLAARRQWGRLISNTLLFRRRLARQAARYHRPERRFHPRPGQRLRTLLYFSRARPLPTGPSGPEMPDPEAGFLRHQIGMGLLYDQLPRQLHAADRSAMAFGVESRFPFLDHELVDWCLTLPDPALINHGWQKYVLRRAFDGRLPAEVSWRADKVGYAAPQDDWLRGPLRAWAEAKLFAPHLQDYPFYDGAALRRAFEEHRTGANREGLLWRWLSIGEFTALFERGAWRRPQPSGAASSQPA